MSRKTYDVTALGELLIDFTENGVSAQGNPLMEANPGGAPCNVLAMLKRLSKKPAFIGKIGEDIFGKQLEKALQDVGIDTRGLKKSEEVRTTLAFVHTMEGGDREFSFYRNPGADMMLEEADLDEALIRDSRIFHYGSLSMTHENCKRATAVQSMPRKKAARYFPLTPICGSLSGEVLKMRKNRFCMEWSIARF